jgi:TetR/AcrR family transcriptional regulator, acrAB operon repressor
MVRRTKDEALETRTQILDTAEELFQKKGVSKTSLDDIARAAGVTRGAIYWHFKNKADLFDALMQRVSLPLEDMAAATADEMEDPLGYVRACALGVIERVTKDAQCQRMQEICHYKVEYVDDMELLRARHIECSTKSLALVERGMRNAAKKGLLAPSVNPKLAAVGLHALVVGLIQNWLLDPKYLALAKTAEDLIDGYIDGLRAKREKKRAPARKAQVRN